MIKALSDKAIQAALDQDWRQAIDYNLLILETKPHHIPTLNRLAKAYKEIGQIDKAVSTYKEVLKLDQYNIIAQRNLESLESHTPNNGHNQNYEIIIDFVEEPGITKTIPLTRLGDPQVIASLQSGQVVQLEPKNYAIIVVTKEGNHIGALTDDIAYQLKTFIKAGNTYQTTIKSASNNAVTIFIKEISRAKKFADVPSFAV